MTLWPSGKGVSFYSDLEKFDNHSGSWVQIPPVSFFFTYLSTYDNLVLPIIALSKKGNK